MLIMKIESHPCYSINLWFIQMGIYGGLKNMLRKIQMADSKKLSFSATTNSQYFFTKISGIGPWVSRLNWYDEHWFCSTYMVVRLSEASSIYCKKTLKCIFSSKLSLHRTAWWPQFFLSRPFWFFFSKQTFFCSISIRVWMRLNLYDYHDFHKNQGCYRFMKDTVWHTM